MIEILYSFAHSKWAKFMIGGLIGSVINRLQNKMSFKAFIANTVISAFVGVVVGVLISNYTNFSNEVVWVIVAVSGSVSKHLYEELGQIVDSASVLVRAFIRAFIRKKLK